MSEWRIEEDLLPYQDRLESRDPQSLDLIVLHCTELPTLQMAREYGEKITLPESQTGFSGHYYLDRDGRVSQYVLDDRRARHVIGYNESSIGIEIVNLGRYPHWYHSKHQECSEPYTLDQLESLKKLLVHLKTSYPNIQKLARHSELDTTMMPAEDDATVQIRRKVDPGPMFPWQEFLVWWNDLCKSFSTK